MLTEPLNVRDPAVDEISLAAVVGSMTTTLDARVATGPAGGRVDETVTVTELDALPPGPWQARVYVTFCVIGPTWRVPDIGWDPDQPPEAVQLDAFFEDQVNVSEATMATERALAVNETEGTGEFGEQVT